MCTNCFYNLELQLIVGITEHKFLLASIKLLTYYSFRGLTGAILTLKILKT
jgi:hypothetical protein